MKKLTKKERDVLALVRRFKKWDEKHCLLWWNTVHSELKMTPANYCRTKHGVESLRHYLLNTHKPIWSPLEFLPTASGMLTDGEGKPKELAQISLPAAPNPLGLLPTVNGR